MIRVGGGQGGEDMKNQEMLRAEDALISHLGTKE
jgi:hypothetical protein